MHFVRLPHRRYCWGKSKQEFRRHINTKATADEPFRRGVICSLGDWAYKSRSGGARQHMHTGRILGCSARARAQALDQQRRRPDGKRDTHANNTRRWLDHAGKPRERKVPLPRSRCWAYARHVRDYERAYLEFETPADLFFAEEQEGCSAYLVVKRHQQLQKTHRCVGEIDAAKVEDREGDGDDE